MSAEQILRHLRDNECASTGQAFLIAATGRHLFEWGTAIPTAANLAHIYLEHDALAGEDLIWVWDVTGAAWEKISGGGGTEFSGVTAGIVSAGKGVLVSDPDKNITGFGFVGVGTGSTANGALVIFNATNNFKATVSCPTLAADRSYTIPDAGADATFVMTAGTQTIGGAKTFSLNTSFGSFVQVTGGCLYAQNNNSTGGADAFVLSSTINEGLRFRTFAQTFASPTTITATTGLNLGGDLPDGAMVVSAQVVLNGTYSTAGSNDCVGLGIAADPDKYGKTTNLNTGQVINTLITSPAVLSGAEDVRLFGVVNGTGALGTGDLTAAGCKVRIVYKLLVSLV
jgi:hypothetical protein